jgi:hypothetical protein
MKFEDPELHKIDKPWESEQKQLNKKGIWVFIIFMVLGFFCFWIFNRDDFNDPFIIYMYPSMFWITGLIVIIGIIYTNFDKKDHWNINLPYNKKLYLILNKEIFRMLKEKVYDFKTEEIPMPRAEYNSKTGKSYSKAYKIKPSMQSDLTVCYALEIISGKYSNSYKFLLQIKNIRKDNLIFAYQLQKDLHGILLRVNYNQYPGKSETIL